MNGQVRVWTKNDLPDIRKIALATWRDAYSHIFPIVDMEKYHKEYYNNKTLNQSFKDKIGFIGIGGDKTIGYLIALEKQDREQFYINSLYILPDYQGRGIGKQLLEIAIQKAKLLGYDKVWLDVMSGNTKAINWYKRQGFVFIEKGTFRMGKTETETLVGCKTI